MSGPLRVFGAVVFERDGATWNYDTQRGGMILLADDGVLLPSPGRDPFVPWSAVRGVRCWAPVPRRESESASDARPAVSQRESGNQEGHCPMHRAMGPREKPCPKG